jgi:hypothetical protein
VSTPSPPARPSPRRAGDPALSGPHRPPYGYRSSPVVVTMAVTERSRLYNEARAPSDPSRPGPLPAPVETPGPHLAPQPGRQPGRSRQAQGCSAYPHGHRGQVSRERGPRCGGRPRRRRRRRLGTSGPIPVPVRRQAAGDPANVWPSPADRRAHTRCRPLRVIDRRGIRKGHRHRAASRWTREADAAHEVVYLETSFERNVRFYGRQGFTVLPGSPGPLSDGGPVMWRMRRRAGSVSKAKPADAGRPSVEP